MVLRTAVAMTSRMASSDRWNYSANRKATEIARQLSKCLDERNRRLVPLAPRYCIKSRNGRSLAALTFRSVVRSFFCCASLARSVFIVRRQPWLISKAPIELKNMFPFNGHLAAAFAFRFFRCPFGSRLQRVKLEKCTHEPISLNKHCHTSHAW